MTNYMTPNRGFSGATVSNDVESTNGTETEAEKASTGSKKVVIILDRRALFRECLARCLESMTGEYTIMTYSGYAEWQQAAARIPAASLVLFCIGAQRAQGDSVTSEISLLAQRCNSTPVILLADDEDPVQIVSALDSGIRGYIPTSMTLDVAIEAMHLVKAGGTYIPATSLLTWRHSVERALASPPADPVTGFTTRQTAVLRALREGKANKIIAYELNMRESTVKVHVRNIMKRLNARNRTEVAFKTRDLFGEIERHSFA
jgi:DNA-binding NarL/FixJ family response regulator